MHHSHDKFGIDESLIDHDVFNEFIRYEHVERDIEKITRKEEDMRKGGGVETNYFSHNDFCHLDPITYI